MPQIMMGPSPSVKRWTSNPVPVRYSLVILGPFVRVYGRDTGKKDASEVIIDEVAGMWSVLLVTPLTLEGYVAAFLAFRLFDITKPFPVNKAEAIPGGAGVMADDLVAGGIAGLVMLVLLQYGILTWPAP